ncbi:PEP-utilizing enzyme, mobile region domain protein [Candidatus Magnetomorum sp. HK-1]|nr:PEP-utilizing enzyme, mobile region domain protein [Candidatus Magnetomorum sp. HK-1]
MTINTQPSWAPYFTNIAGIVTDTGGILSHCAVVAREYGIPAVMSLKDATVIIKDGDDIEVDGGKGIVRVF